MFESKNNPGSNLYRYEDILRAIGKYIDEQELQDVVVLQAENEIKVHGYRNVSAAGGLRPRLIQHTFTADELRQIDEEARKRRGSGSRLFG
jgi:hypothetical protein